MTRPTSMSTFGDEHIRSEILSSQVDPAARSGEAVGERTLSAMAATMVMAVLLGALLHVAGAAAAKPHILMVVVDDFGWADAGA